MVPAHSCLDELDAVARSISGVLRPLFEPRRIGSATSSVATLMTLLSLGLEARADPLEEPSRGQGGPYTHDGFYAQCALGVGYLRSSPAETSEFSGVNKSSMVAIGGSPIPGLALAGALIAEHATAVSQDELCAGSSDGGQCPGNATDAFLLALGLHGDFYPDPGDGLHFQAFTGFGSVVRKERQRPGGPFGSIINGPQYDNVGPTSTGLIVALGLGYEFFVKQEWSMGPLFRFTYTPFTTMAVSLNLSSTLH